MLIDWFTVAAQAVNFLILVWLLKRFLYKPVLAAIDEREKGIAALLKDAEQKKAAAAQEEAKFHQKNEDFEKQRAALMLQVTHAVETERTKLLETARHEGEDLRAKSRKGAQDELEAVGRKVTRLVQQEAFSIARKALIDLAGASLDDRMIEVFSKKVAAMNEDERNKLSAPSVTGSAQALLRCSFDPTATQRDLLERATRPLLATGTEIAFETRPDLIGGIELTANGHKVAWSISGYLDSLAQAMGSLIDAKSASTKQEALPHAA